MATKSVKPVARETSAFVRERGMRPLIVTIHHSMLLLRPKGLRNEEVIALEDCWSLAVKKRVARDTANKKTKKRT